jgi:transcription antitermination factor NusG
VTHVGEATFGCFQKGANLTPLTVADEGSWFAVQTKPRHEKRAVVELEEKGIATFLPLFSAVHQWSDRKRKVQLPLFANYVFVRISEDREIRVTVLQTNGVFRFVGGRGAGVVIPDEQIESIQAIVRGKIPFVPYPFLGVGKKVRVRGGSLDGLQGVILSINGDKSLILSVESIQKSIAIRIAGYQVEAA